jgi:hypothetical protein
MRHKGVMLSALMLNAEMLGQRGSPGSIADCQPCALWFVIWYQDRVIVHQETRKRDQQRNLQMLLSLWRGVDL